MKSAKSVFFLTCASTLFFTSVPAFGAAINYSFDENCIGTSSAGGAMNCMVWKDPISGQNTILYTLPGAVLNGLISGDFRLIGESGQLGDISDLLRFDVDLNGFFVFSDDVGGGSMADVGVPGSFPGHQDFEHEIAPGVFGIIYTPNPGDPGYMNGGVTYTFTSSVSAVPEPSTALLMALPLAFLLLRRRRSSGVRSYAGRWIGTK